MKFVRSTREVWIKAKYVEKVFVKHTTLPNVSEKFSSAVVLSPGRWSVYKRKRKTTMNESLTASTTADTDSTSTKGMYLMFNYAFFSAVPNIRIGPTSQRQLEVRLGLELG